MFHSRRAGAGLAAMLLVMGAAFALSACASTPTSDSGADQTTQQNGQPDDNGQSDQTETDGSERPGAGHGANRAGRTVRRTGVRRSGRCRSRRVRTLVQDHPVFWGGSDPIPDGVRFTFETAEPDQPGLAVEPGVCGSAGADRTCLGMTVEANETGIFCSIEVRPDSDFVEGTTISFTGTLECPTSDDLR